MLTFPIKIRESHVTYFLPRKLGLCCFVVLLSSKYLLILRQGKDKTVPHYHLILARCGVLVWSPGVAIERNKYNLFPHFDSVVHTRYIFFHTRYNLLPHFDSFLHMSTCINRPIPRASTTAQSFWSVLSNGKLRFYKFIIAVATLAFL